MRAVVQRVREASVSVDARVASSCSAGMVVLLGVANADTVEVADRLAGKVARLRIFENEEGKFDRSLLDVGGEALARADSDVILMAAAVGDYRSSAPAEGKRPKDGVSWVLELEPTTDVLAAIGRGRSAEQVVVGFAADAGADGLERARTKRVAKNADLVVFNDVSRSDIGFDTVENEVVLVSENGDREIPKAPKPVVAAAVLDEVERLL